MNVTFHRTSDGQRVEQAEALERGIIRDGYTMRSNVLLMDGATVGLSELPSGYTDAQLAQMDAYDKRISNAWRNPDADFAPTKAPAARVADTESAYQRYDRQIVDAWR